MAKKKDIQESADGILVTAAKTIGGAAGKIAAAIGVEAAPKTKARKPEKKNKQRLPRRQKKAAQKAAK